jgi:RNA polymerase subunit RPABC4/transcription elongation factor Spt4
MSNGISFYEACKHNPTALTKQQLQNCPEQNSQNLTYAYAGIAGFTVIICLILFFVIKSKHSKNSS